MDRRSFLKAFGIGSAAFAVPAEVIAKPTIWERMKTRFVPVPKQAGAFFDKSYLPYVERLVRGRSITTAWIPDDDVVDAEVKRILAEERAKVWA